MKHGSSQCCELPCFIALYSKYAVYGLMHDVHTGIHTRSQYECNGSSTERVVVVVVFFPAGFFDHYVTFSPATSSSTKIINNSRGAVEL